MPTFNAELRRLTVRVVYDGLAMAGKTTNVRRLSEAFAQTHGGALRAPGGEDRGRTRFFDWLELQAGWLDDVPLRCEALTVPGQLALAQRRWWLLQDIDAVVLVVDSTPAGVERARIALSFLLNAAPAVLEPTARLVVQCNKQDLPDALSPDDIAERLSLPASVRVVGAAAEQGHRIRETFYFALDAARTWARHVLRDRAPESLSPELGPDAVLESLHAMENVRFEGDILAQDVLGQNDPDH
ncbi:gliding motility protein MglA [Minicystis rosea]|nr:gliding motility protein MglA [Minicystis rosea]